MSEFAKLVDFSMGRATNDIKRNTLNKLLDMLPEDNQKEFHEVLWKSGVPNDELDLALLQCENILRSILNTEVSDWLLK